MAACLIAAYWPLASCAQDADDARGGNGAKRSETIAQQLSRPEDAETMPDDAGVLILKGEALRQYRQWQQNRDVPAYSITRVSFDGEVVTAAQNERVRLTAAIRVQVNRADEAIEVPLNLNEATLTDHRYEGPGEATPASSFDRDTGYRWWFRGRGTHELTLTLLVPVKKQLPSRRLQLTIPETAVSRLRLRVPAEGVTVKAAPKDAWIKKNGNGGSGTVLEMQWFGKRLDFSWQPLTDRQPLRAVLQSRTFIKVEPTSESVILRVTTTLQALKGSFSNVQVRLPADFELLVVEGKYYGNHEVADGNHATVELTEPISGSEPIELKWTLEHKDPLPKNRGTLTLDGFEVQGALRQTGEIAVGSLEGFRIFRREGADRKIHRTSVSDLAADDGIFTAYAFYGQPFRLVLDFAEIEPKFTAKPDLQLRLTPDRALLDAVFSFDCYHGAVPEIPVDWPGFEREGWTIEAIDPPSLVDQGRVPKQPVEGVLTVPLLRRTRGKFELRIQASRPVPDEDSLALSFPSVNASPRQPTLLTLTPAENLEVALLPAEATAARPVGAAETAADDSSNEFSESRSETWQVESREHAFRATVTVHDREVTARSESVVELDQQTLQVTQNLTYEVAWGRLSRLLLLVPEELQQNVLFTTDDGVELRPSWRSSTENGPAEARLNLPQPNRGEFTVAARFLVDLKEKPSPGRRLAVSVPFITPFEFELATTALEFRHGSHIQAALGDQTHWVSQSSVPLSSRWTTEEAPSEATLEISLRTGDIAQDYIVRRALVRSKLDVNGTVISRAQYRVEGPVSTIVLDVPDAAVEVDDVWWDREKLGAERIVRPPEQPAELHLHIAEAPTDGGHLLTVDYHSKAGGRTRWVDRHELSAPVVAPSVWTQQSLWVVSVPRDQLLFRRSPRWTPAFRWSRRMFLWSRQPAPQFADPLQWISAGDGPEDRPELSGGNHYHLSRLGAAPRLALATMSLPIVVLLGAGLAFLSGLMLLYIPATRNVLTVLASACGVAAVALWYPEPVKLLLQPALLGLALAAVAALIHRALNREKSEPLLTLSSPSDFASPAPSSLERPVPASAGSEEPTSSRPPAEIEREAVSAPESGSHV